MAVQLNLDTAGFKYEKWGQIQICKQGDWMVNNNGDVYTIDQQIFANTYKENGKGQYFKSIVVWAEVADKAGVIQTKEGSTYYRVGDCLVYNDVADDDAYAISREKFEKLYDKASK